MKPQKTRSKKRFNVVVDKRGVVTTVYLSTKTVITTVDRNGNVETTVKPLPASHGLAD